MEGVDEVHHVLMTDTASFTTTGGAHFLGLELQLDNIGCSGVKRKISRASNALFSKKNHLFVAFLCLPARNNIRNFSMADTA